MTKLDHIFLLQKKAVRICTKSSYLSHTDPLFVTLHHKTTRKSPDMEFELRPHSKRGDSKL